MVKACIVYFSQTGNTEQVAFAIMGRLLGEGAEALALPLSDIEDFPEALEGIDMLGIGYPTFYGYPPMMIMEFIDRFVYEGNNKSAFVFTTYGGTTSGDSLYDVAKALAAKGYRIVGGLKIEAQDSYPQSMDLKINQGRPDIADLDKAEEFAARMLQSHNEGRSLDPEKLASGNEFFIEHRNQGRSRTLEELRKGTEGRVIFNRDLCIFCEACKKSCPTKSITSGEKFPEFSWKCIDGMKCFQCVRVCPGKALRVEYPSSLDEYRKFLEMTADSPEEKSRAYMVA